MGKDILFISALSSKRLIDEIHKGSGLNPGFAVQKFCRLLVKGLIFNDANVISLSNPPITQESGVLCAFANEFEDGVKYKYIPYVNMPFVNHICVFLYTFLYVLFWGFYNKKDKAILCDVLCISSCLAALIASKINRTKSVAIVTDIYSQLAGQTTSVLNSFISKLAGILQNWYSKSFTEYVLLTEQMNDIVNPHKRPYVVMEALCDNNVTDEQIEQSVKAIPKVLMYAGGLEEKYGIKMLVEGFLRVNRNDIKLILYGHGSYVEELKLVCAQDSRIEYRGVALNEEVVKSELKATLLVNPRFSTEEFVRYSFPSKNMEYMASGTPLLTTCLPSMPKEYIPYVFLFENETVDGYSRSIERVLANKSQELKQFGLKARRFVLEEKNNIIQSKKIIDLINKQAQ